MDFGCVARASCDGLESIERGVAMMRGCRLRAGVSSTRGFATGLWLRVRRVVWRWFVRGVDDVRVEEDGVSFAEFVRGVDGPPCTSHARSNAERSRCPCSTTSSSSRVSSSWVSRNPICRVDAISARAGRPMGRVYPRTWFRSTKHYW